jgi:hypothetical protein
MANLPVDATAFAVFQMRELSPESVAPAIPKSQAIEKN